MGLRRALFAWWTGLAAGERFGQEIGQRLLQVEPAGKAVAQRKQAAGHQRQAGHQIDGARHGVGHGAAHIHGLGEAAGLLKLSAADVGSHARVGIDFAEKERGGEVVGEPEALVDQLGDGVRRRHLPLHAIDSESGGRQGDGERHRPAQDLGTEEQQQNEGGERGNGGIRPLGEELVA